MKANNTMTIDEVIGQYCDNHDFVILSNSKVNKDGTFWITTDDGREKVTMDILEREFGIVAYCGNGVYKMKGDDEMIKATDNINF